MGTSSSRGDRTPTPQPGGGALVHEEEAEAGEVRAVPGKGPGTSTGPEGAQSPPAPSRSHERLPLSPGPSGSLRLVSPSDSEVGRPPGSPLHGRRGHGAGVISRPRGIVGPRRAKNTLDLSYPLSRSPDLSTRFTNSADACDGSPVPSGASRWEREAGPGPCSGGASGAQVREPLAVTDTQTRA